MGKKAVELGCGTAYFSAWLAKLGMKPIGVDITPAQLASARDFQKEFRIEFPLLEASAEQVPLRGERFDLVLSEYGASIWCDPYKWVPEAARLLRPGGVLVFLRNATVAMMCSGSSGPVQERLMRDYFGMFRFEWDEDEGIEFHLPTGPMLRLLRHNGFELEDLVEIQAPEGAKSRFDHVSAEWARRWPSEELWRLRKR